MLVGYLPSDVKHIILGKLPVNERYKCLSFNHYESSVFFKNKRVGRFYLNHHKFRRSPLLDNEFTDYLITYGELTNLPIQDSSSLLGKLMKLARYKTADSLKDLQRIATNQTTYKTVIRIGDPALFRLLLSSTYDIEIYKHSMSREMIAVFLDYFETQAGIRAWITTVPPMFIDHPDLVQRYIAAYSIGNRGADYDCTGALNLWMERISFKTLYDKGCFNMTHIGFLTVSVIEKVAQQYCFDIIILGILEYYCNDWSWLIVPWFDDVDGFKSLLSEIGRHRRCNRDNSIVILCKHLSRFSNKVKKKFLDKCSSAGLIGNTRKYFNDINGIDKKLG